jgi:hypothetical protein
MKTAHASGWRRLAIGFLLLVIAPPALAATPEWLRAAARDTLPSYPPDTVAVILLVERIVTVDDNGRMKTTVRLAYRILRPDGRRFGTISVPFDKDTKLTFLKGWTIPASGKDYEVKEKDAVEFGGSDELYSDYRSKVLSLPAADPGNVVGFEFEQDHRPYVFEDRWLFQDPLPVRRARLVLQLAPGWEFQDVWMNHPPQQPKTSGTNSWTWELTDVPAVKVQPEMPPWRAVAGWMAVRYFSPRADLAQKGLANWKEMGAWYGNLTQGRRTVSPEIKQKVAELTAGQATTLEKIAALAAFSQRDIRYVAIEIGIGGLQPHYAADIFKNRYGDCKDKATLLSSMLSEIGIQSYYVPIHTSRGVVAPEFPGISNFNHAILAIRLPADLTDTSLYSVLQHEKLGRLLFFDPTNEMTPMGHLPTYLQASHGLLVTEEGGELLTMPLQAPQTNRLYRVGKLQLSPTGALSGDIQEVRWGGPAVTQREAFLARKGEDRQKVLENFLTGFLGGFLLTRATAENLEAFDKSLVLRYGFAADNYAKRAGNLMMVRPRVLDQKSSDVLEGEERAHPVEFDAASLETDTFEISLPPGYKLDEIPPPVELDYGFAEYRSKVELEGNVLRYHREYKVKEVKVPAARLADLKKFYRQIAADERASAVLTRSP